MPSATPHYALSKPEVGADSGTWGGDLNDNTITKIDSHLARHGLPRTTPSPSAGVITLDLATHRVFVFTVGENLTVNISNFPTVEPSNPFVRFWIIVTTSASFSLSFNAAFLWDSVNKPNFQTSGTFVLECFATAAGTIHTSVHYRSVAQGALPLVQAVNSGDQAVTSDTPFALSFTSAPIDTHAVSGVGMFNIASPTRLTVLAGQGGIYRIRGKVVVNSGSSDTLEVDIRKNGSTSLAKMELGNAGELATSFDVYASMIAGDYVELVTDVFGTFNYTVRGGSGVYLSFSAERIR